MSPWLFSALVLASALACSQAATITGVVVGVADGDTATVLDASKTEHKIRLAGIDAPEKRQAFGARSKQSLSDLVFEKPVTVETEKKDRYRQAIQHDYQKGEINGSRRIQRSSTGHHQRGGEVF